MTNSSSHLVRDEAFITLRALGMTKVFSNPGSTEIAFLENFPKDFEFILGLHENAVVAMATGVAIGSGQPSLALLHTTAGLGNAVGAIATARVNHAPLVIIVGQQDRRHLSLDPFLAGRLVGLAGDYPVSYQSPELASEVPNAIRKAYHDAVTHDGPAIVVVAMDMWAQSFEPHTISLVQRVVVGHQGGANDCDEIIDALRQAHSPVMVVGAEADSSECWDELTTLAEKLNCPVWQEPFGARAGFPQSHRLFQGHLPSSRSRLASALSSNDVVLVVGAQAFRQYPYEAGGFTSANSQTFVLTKYPQTARSSVAKMAVVGDLAAMVRTIHESLAQNPAPPKVTQRPTDAKLHAELTPSFVFDLIARDSDEELVLVEETPSSRGELQRLVPARRPLGFLSAAMGGLGFALPGSIGVKMALSDRPVIAVIGDGSSLYGIQALWSAVRYQVGVVVIVLINHRYAIMDRLIGAQVENPQTPWPSFEELDIIAIAKGFGCQALEIQSVEELERELPPILTNLANRRTPVVVGIHVRDSAHFAP